jgi:cardiolipin synthase
MPSGWWHANCVAPVLSMNLLVLPGDGLAPIVRALRRAKDSVRLTIFRCDLPEIEKALGAAAARGVAVHALIAENNRAGEKQLRKLELRLLGAGITVSRTADDLVRYHDKFLVIDERVLFVFGFNFTRLELSKRRSLAIATRKRRFVAEALALFEADATRQDYTGAVPDFVVSPVNARARLEKLLAKARESLRIYDPQAIDPALLRVLKKRAESGVDVRILGRVGRAGSALRAEKLPELRLHVRAILRDDRELFIGSQGLRTIELDRRRELGIVLRDRSAIKRFRDVFEADWEGTDAAREEREAA